MTEKTLADITAEIEGIVRNLDIISTALDPHDEFEHHPEAFNMSIWAIARYLERIQDELDKLDLKLRVKP